MAQELQRLILSLNQPGLMGVGSELWNSTDADHRERIRASYRSTLGLPEQQDSPPRPEKFSLSVSHCKRYGGWLAVPRPVRVGFDVEESTRIQTRIIERTCSKQEITAAPDPSYLWCAKEAYFKALEHEQPAVVTELTIDGWISLGSGIFGFGAGADIGARGVIFEAQGLYFCACLVVSN